MALCAPCGQGSPAETAVPPRESSGSRREATLLKAADSSPEGPLSNQHQHVDNGVPSNVRYFGFFQLLLAVNSHGHSPSRKRTQCGLPQSRRGPGECARPCTGSHRQAYTGLKPFDCSHVLTSSGVESYVMLTTGTFCRGTWNFFWAALLPMVSLWMSSSCTSSI